VSKRLTQKRHGGKEKGQSIYTSLRAVIERLETCVQAPICRVSAIRSRLGFKGALATFHKRTDARRCSPVSLSDHREALLNAGDASMKPARELLKGGRVSEAKYEPPLLSVYVREGAKTTALAANQKRARRGNLCSCWDSRSAGKSVRTQSRGLAI